MYLRNRREFLDEARRWAAALTAAGLSGPLLADDPKPDAKDGGSAADRIRVAVIGANRKSGRGYEHVGWTAGRNNVELVAICDCDEASVGESMARAEKAMGKKPRYEKDLRRIMDDKSIDAVTIATPNHWHSLAAIWALQSGKHVYVEKPVSHNVWEGRQLVAAARKYGKICQTGTQSRSFSAMREMIDYIHTGKLGTISVARAMCYKPRTSIGSVAGDGAAPKSMDYDLWCGPAPSRPPRRTKVHYDWHWQWDYGNGDIGNQGIHQMDIARWGLNKSTLPNTVVSVGGRFGPKDDGETPNTMLSQLDYGDSKLIFEVRGLPTLDVLADQRGTSTTDKRQIAKVGNVFYGTEGYIITAYYADAVAVGPDGSILKVFHSGDHDHFGNFCKAIRSGSRSDLTADVEEGHLSSALCHLANISYRLGREMPMNGVSEFGDDMSRMSKHLAANGVVMADTQCRVGPRLTLNAKTERFVGNDAADALLSREYRKGFEVPSQV